MSEAKGPYSTGDSVGLVFKDGREVENFDSERDKLNACRLANAAWSQGRASRDGLRDRIVEITNILLDYRDWHKQCAVDDGSDMALGAYRAWENKIKRVLKADGRGNERDRETL